MKAMRDSVLRPGIAAPMAAHMPPPLGMHLLRPSRPGPTPFCAHRCKPARHARPAHTTRSAATGAPAREGNWFHTLEDGLRLEVISAQAQGADERPPLLFIHGSGHGAWCWQERFLPYFAERGFTCHALSLRGQAGSDAPPGAKAGGSLASHAEDISHFISTQLTRSPILVGHSFGGLLTQTYVLKGYSERPPLAGLALLASVPPQGNQEMTARFWKRSKLDSLRLTWAFVSKSYQRKPSEARLLFFSDDLPDAELQRYFGLLRDKRGSVPVVDVRAINEELPLPPPPPGAPPAFVAGGTADSVVDVPGVEASAEHFGVRPTLLQGHAHDLMLDTRWREAAEALEGWCRGIKA